MSAAVAQSAQGSEFAVTTIGSRLISGPRAVPSAAPVRRGTSPRPQQDVGVALFAGVRQPADHPRHGEGGGEQLAVEAESVQQEGGVELHIGLQMGLRPVLGEDAQRHLLDGARLAVEFLGPKFWPEFFRKFWPV